MTTILRQIVIFSLAIGIAILAACKSPFDPATSEGTSLLNDLDSTIADFNTAFRVLKDSLPVTSAKSIRTASVFISTTLQAGNVSNDKALAYFEFDTIHEFTDSTVDSIKSVTLSFRPDKVVLNLAADTTSLYLYKYEAVKSLTAIIDTNLIITDSLIDTLTFTKTKTDPNAKADSAARYYQAITVELPFAEYLARFKKSGMAFDTHYVDTVRKTAACSSSVDSCIRDTTKMIIDTFSRRRMELEHLFYAVTPVAGDAGIIRFARPQININYYKKKGTAIDTTVYTDSISARYGDYSVFEDNPAERDSISKSSYPADRYTEIILDAHAFWDSANAVYKGRTYRALNACNLIIPVSLSQKTSESADSNVQVSYYIGETPLLLGPKRFSTVHILGTSNLYLNLGIDLSPKYAARLPVDTLYLYLHLESSNNAWRFINWDMQPGKTIHIEAAVSNPQ